RSAEEGPKAPFTGGMTQINWSIRIMGALLLSVGTHQAIASTFPSPDTRALARNHDSSTPNASDVEVVVYTNRSGQSEFDYVLAPFANPDRIALDVDRHYEITMGSDGQVRIHHLQVA